MPSTNFVRAGKAKIYWLPACAAFPAAPTSGEVTAGTDLSARIAEVRGFKFTAQTVETPNLASSLTGKISGRDQLEDCGLMLYDIEETVDPEAALLVKGALGFIAIWPKGKAAGKLLQVWKVTSTGLNPEITVANDPAKLDVLFSVNEIPALNLVSP